MNHSPKTCQDDSKTHATAIEQTAWVNCNYQEKWQVSSATVASYSVYGCDTNNTENIIQLLNYLQFLYIKSTMPRCIQFYDHVHVMMIYNGKFRI